MDLKCFALLILSIMVVSSLAGPLQRERREVSKDAICIHPLYPLLCADRKACIKESQVCDGLKSCLDNSDEENCGDKGTGDNGNTDGNNGPGGGADNGGTGNAGGDAGAGDGGAADSTGDQNAGDGGDVCNVGTTTKGSCTNPTGGATCNTGVEDLRQQMLNSHNYYRCLHGLNGERQMTLSDELNNYAQAWADQLASTGSSAHSTNRGENPPNRGENIWTGSDYYRWKTFEEFTGEAPVGDWYSEIKNYDYKTNTGIGNAMVGHFTQVIWKLSTELGCGVGRSQKPWGPKFTIVCQYRESGNLANPSENVPALQ